MSNKGSQNMDNHDPLLMGLRQLRAYLGISDKLARELVNEPGFSAVLIHGRYMIFRDEVKDCRLNARSNEVLFHERV